MLRLLFILIISLTTLVFAQSNEECMDCHSDDELTKFIDDSTEISLYVDMEVYNSSVHADMECIDCHSGIEDVDHEPELPDVDCSQCHDGSLEEYAESVHGPYTEHDIAIETGCTHCHGTHNIRYSDDPESMTYPLNIANTCGECHSRPEVIRLTGRRGDGPVAAYKHSVHGKILMEDPERGAPTCVDCHNYHEIYVMSDPRSSYNKLHLSESCGQCHEQAETEYNESIHWRSVKRGRYESPTCNDCHGEHSILSPSDEDAVTNRLNSSTQICANCHSSPTMMSRYGLDHERMASYNRTYHGLAILKGSEDAANCTSCHEVHAIRSQDNPESSVHPSNLQSTCGNCHANVSAEFVKIPSHPIGLADRNIVAYFAENIYIWLIILVVGGMFIHNLVILRYYILQKRDAFKNERTYQRFQPFEVYQHMLLILSFGVLVVTGFALKFPDAFWVRWLFEIGLDEAARSLLHRIAAVVLVIISLIQAGYFIASRKGRKEIYELRPTVSDITGFWQNMKYHLRLNKQRPRFGRWDYTEKAEYLALIWGTAVMAVTGFVLWFPEFFMSIFPAWIFETSEIIHYYEAILATLAIIIWHWFFVIYHPEKYPMSLTWANGKITEEELKHHHPLEYEELKAMDAEKDKYEHPDGITTIRDKN